MFDTTSITAADSRFGKLCDGAWLCCIAHSILQQASKDGLEMVNQDISPTQIKFIDEEKSAFNKPKNLISILLGKLERCHSKILWHSVVIISSIQRHNYYRPFNTSVLPVAIL